MVIDCGLEGHRQELFAGKKEVKMGNKADTRGNKESKLDMTDEVYERLADQLNALPNSFPRTQSGVEIRLLKKIARPEEAWMASQLGRKMESAEEISARVGLPMEEVTNKLRAILRRGLVRVADRGGVRHYRLAPFLVGIYEAQLHKMDHELAHLFEQYMMLQGVAQGILGTYPPLHRVIPAQQTVKSEWILPYDDARALLLQAKSYSVRDCICRVEQDLLGSRSCSFPLRNCLAFSGVEHPTGPATISQKEALAILDETEEIGLVHTASNNVRDVGYICNCCGCCCGILRGITQWGIENSVARANYYSEIDPADCVGCEICVDRCQVGAISMKEGLAVVDSSRCIGCGLCVTGCPDKAVHLHVRPDAQLIHPPADFMAWEEERLLSRGLAE